MSSTIGRSLRWLESPAGQFVAVACLTLIAAGLRFYKLGEWSFWIDELYSIRRALRQTELREIVDRWPPVSTLLMGATLRQLGVSEWSARLVPALIGVLSIPALYLPVRQMVGHRAALVAALLLAVSPWHLFWSQNSRYYTALMLLYGLASLAVFFALERNRAWLILIFYVLLVAAFRERYLALFPIPVVITYLLLLVVLRFERPAGFGWRSVGLLSLGGLALLVYDAHSLIWRGYSQILAVTTPEFVDPVEDPFRLAASSRGRGSARRALSPGLQSGRRDRRDRREARSHGRVKLARPWTSATLNLVARFPGRRAPALAELLGYETKPFKANVRKLKALGLTESLPVGTASRREELSLRGSGPVRIDEIGSRA